MASVNSEEVIPHFKEGEYEWFVMTPNSWGRSDSSEHKARRSAISNISWSYISSEFKEVPIVVFQIKDGLEIKVSMFGELNWDGEQEDVQEVARVKAKRPRGE